MDIRTRACRFLSGHTIQPIKLKALETTQVVIRMLYLVKGDNASSEIGTCEVEDTNPALPLLVWN